MIQTRNLIAFFVVTGIFLACLAWWYGTVSLKFVGLVLAAWFVVGLGSAALELAAIPNDPQVPKRYRIAGQIFRGICAGLAVLLIVAALVGIWREQIG